MRDESSLPDIDAEIARSVFGVKSITVRSLRAYDTTSDEWGIMIPAYSEFIQDAWLVVEKMQSLGYGCGVFTAGLDLWHCSFDPGDGGVVLAEAPIASLAICRAALAAIASSNRVT